MEYFMIWGIPKSSQEFQFLILEPPNLTAVQLGNMTEAA